MSNRRPVYLSNLVMDLEHLRPFGTAIILACLLGIGVIKIIAVNKVAKLRSQADQFIGSYPFSPRPLTVSMDRATAKRKFIQGLVAMQVNQGWSIKNADPNSSELNATMRWSSKIVDGSGRYARSTSINSSLILRGQVLSQGAQTLIQWSYDRDAQSWSDPSNHRMDPKAEEFAIEANYQILKALGLIVGTQ
jgi:hypothetical protein